MSFQSANLPFRQVLNNIISRRYLFILVGIILLAILFRCLHLFNTNYFVISADSYFFHWLAGRIVTGEGLPADAPAGALHTLHTGLTYPLVYLGKAMSYVFNLSSADAINFSAELFPPLLGAVSLVVIYLAGSKIFNRRVGLFSALAWALMLLAVYISAAGYIDRDGLSVLLIMAGALVFYFTQYFHLRIGKWDLGWLAGGLGVLVLEVLLYLEWTYPGPILLLAIIAAYILVILVVKYLYYAKLKPNALQALKSTLYEVNWRTFVVVIAGNLLFFLLNPNTDAWVKFMVETVGSGGKSGVAEMGGIGFYDVLLYQFFLIPMVLGIYVAWKERSNGTIFIVSWFIVLFVLSLFSRRVLIYALPAVCLLSGVGLGFLWKWQRRGKSQDWRKIGVSTLLFLLIVVSFIFVSLQFSNPVTAVNEEWQDALSYLREKTPEDAVVMTNWGWGYWILDLGERRPVVDNGFYYYNDQKLHDVGLVYTTSDPVEAVQTMQKYGANYIIFSQIDLNFQPLILKWVGLDKRYQEFPDNSLFIRVLNGEFEAEGGLKVVYRSVPGNEVIILSSTHSE